MDISKRPPSPIPRVLWYWRSLDGFCLTLIQGHPHASHTSAALSVRGMYKTSTCSAPWVMIPHILMIPLSLLSTFSFSYTLPPSTPTLTPAWCCPILGLGPREAPHPIHFPSRGPVAGAGAAAGRAGSCFAKLFHCLLFPETLNNHPIKMLP